MKLMKSFGKKLRITDWFFENYMILNQQKNAMCPDKNKEGDTLEFESISLNNGKQEATSGLTDSHKKINCSKASQKI